MLNSNNTQKDESKELEMKRPTCPTCEKPVDMSANPNRPFCCERCQLVDLGRWFGEGYSMPIEGEEDKEFVSEQIDDDPDSSGFED